MAILVSIYLGLKGLAILVGTVVSGGGEGKVTLQIISMELESDTVRINMRIDSIYSPELDNFCESGTAIPLRLETSLLSEKGLAFHRITTNFLKYDLSAKHYRLIKSQDTVYIADKEEAKKRFPEFSVPLFAVSNMREEGDYRLKVHCRLGKVRLDILDMNEFDLMSLWNFKTPTLETKRFRKRDLVAGREE